MLFWLPSYFSSRYHLDLKNLGLPLIVVYVATSIGSISGGWLSSKLISRGWSVQRARQSAMLGLAFLVVPIAFSPWIDNMWAMVGLLSLAAAAHQGWSANLFTTASDMFPKKLAGRWSASAAWQALSGELFSHCSWARFWITLRRLRP
jgi:ACS family hexuronate transporter-like MFS transporter